MFWYWLDDVFDFFVEFFVWYVDDGVVVDFGVGDEYVFCFLWIDVYVVVNDYVGFVIGEVEVVVFVDVVDVVECCLVGWVMIVGCFFGIVVVCEFVVVVEVYYFWFVLGNFVVVVVVDVNFDVLWFVD